jgi:integrase
MATIRKRALPSGQVRWQVDYRDGGGKRRWRHFATRKAADAFLVQARHQIAIGIHTPDAASATVGEAARLWLDRCEANGLEASTLKAYRSHVDIHIVPRIGAEKLSRLSTPMLEGVADRLAAQLSRKHARKILVSIKSIVKEAQRRGLIAHNPALPVRIDVPSRHEQAVKIPTKAELRLMLERVTDRWRPLLVTAMLTGLRASELRGLTWEHVDLAARVIRVRQRADEFSKIGSPKSRAGRRDVPLSPIVINTLKEWRLACPKGDRGLVFPTAKGGVMHAPDILRQCWYPLMTACELTGYDFHHLRHAAASLLIEQGAQPKRIQEIMGHSSIKVTFDIYGHLFADADADQRLMSAAEQQLFR